jgi:hypothetical protein
MGKPKTLCGRHGKSRILDVLNHRYSKVAESESQEVCDSCSISKIVDVTSDAIFIPAYN